MGIQDFIGMFDMIDVSHKGYITASQLHHFCEDVYFTPVSTPLVDGAIKYVCGSPSSHIQRQSFIEILQDLERRRSIDEQAYWDFQALDFSGSNRISLKDSLLLFKEYHGDGFSASTWRKFLSSREESDADVYFDEIRYWLSAVPSGTPFTDKELKEEENRLELRQTQYKHDSSAYKFIQDDSLFRKKEEDENRNDMTRDSRRMLDKWNKQGVESILFDDGLEADESNPQSRPKGQITPSDMFNMLEVKYEKLKEKLLMDMAKFSAAVESEEAELLEQLRRQEKDLHYKRRVQTHGDGEEELPGGSLMLYSGLMGLMGELKKENIVRRKEMEDLKAKLKWEGKTEAEISHAVQEHYKSAISVNKCCSAILKDLHTRHQTEREEAMKLLHSDDDQPLEVAMAIEYGRLVREVAIIEEQQAERDSFVLAATAVGLAERALEQVRDRTDWDRMRSEHLAQLQLLDKHNKKPLKATISPLDVTAASERGTTDLQIDIIREVTQKHFFEREALIDMLQGADSKKNQEKSKKMKPEDIKRQLKALTNQHKTLMKTSHADSISLHKLLFEAVCLYRETRRGEIEISFPNISEVEINMVVLADLQQRQGVDFEIKLQQMQTQKMDGLVFILHHENEACIQEHYEGIAYITLGTLEISEDDTEFIKALDEKYETLRRSMFLMAIQDSFGKEYKNLSKSEKRDEITRKKKEEKSLRAQGKFEEMATLLGMKAKMLASLREMMGEEKAEFEQRMTHIKQMGQSPGPDEAKVNKNKEINHLADLVHRYDSEQDTLLSYLQSPEARGQNLRTRRLKIVELMLETKRIKFEDDFEVAALSAGLMERIRAAIDGRHKSDRDRQSQLARRRVQLRQNRINENEQYTRESDVKKKPENGDITGWQTVYLVEMMKRHMDERELMLSVLQDEGIDELVEAAAKMSHEEKQKRLAELQGKGQTLNLDIPDDKEEQIYILEEAAAIFASKRIGHSGIGMDEVIVGTLTELQDEQDKELALALHDVDTMDEDALGQRLTDEVRARVQGTAINVIIILTRYEGIAQDSDLLQALNQKYEMLQEKLFADGLVGRIGTDPWQRLDYSEKQQRLQALKVHAIKGDKTGRHIPAIAGDGFVLLEPILEFIGMPVSEFNVKITDLRQQLSGHIVHLKIPEESSLYTNRQNPFVDIKSRLEEDKADLLRRLRGQTGEGYGECERLIHLIRLRREKKLAEQEQTFDMAARLIGLCERQQVEIRVRLLRDKERYRCLAQERMKAKDGDPTTGSQNEISKSKDKLSLLDHMMDLLERKHRHERQIFNQMLSQTDKYSEIQQMAALSTQQQRQDKLSKLRSERLSQIQGGQKELQEILQEAVIIKIEDRRHRLSWAENTEGLDDQQVNMSLMGDLLEQQNSEAERILQSVADKAEADILDKQRQVISDRDKGMCENIAQVVFTVDSEDMDPEADLVEALEGKYDALRDQLLAEALLKELGESEWNRMTEKEKQKRLLQLKLKERQLRKAGKYDEAAALLGDFLKTQDTLRQLMGDTKEEQKRRAEERLKKRKLRLQQGMTEEECDKLEAKEIAEEEEEDKQRKRNILLDLQHRFEKEKEELLQRINEGADEFERERERQSLLTKLRRDQRLAREEDKFESAALILGLADKHDKNYLEERHRQEQLARDRLEAARQHRRQGQPFKEYEEEEGEMTGVDHENITALQEAAVRDLDHKHRKERDLLIELLNEQTNGGHRDAARNMKDEERDEKLQELLEIYKLWQKSDDKNPSQEKELLEEAVGTRVEDLQQKFQKEGEPKSDDDLQVTLLADLQQQQERESQKFLSNLQDMDLKTLQKLCRAQTTLKQKDNHANVATVLLDHDEEDTITHVQHGEAEEEVSERKLMKALESKYDAVRDKLFLEALIKEYGEQEWNKLTEIERQRKLVRMKLKERKLRKEGKLDMAAGILSDYEQSEKLLEEIFGESKLDQKQKVQERLRRRKELIKQRQAEGLATDDTTINTIIEEEQRKEEEENKKRRRNILLELQNCFDDEKAVILGALKRQKDKIAEDRERQIAMAKLRRDKRRLQKEAKIQSVVMLISSAKEYEQRREEGLLAERERQRAVARERLSARIKKRQGKNSTEENLNDKKQSQLEEVVQDAIEGRTVADAVLETVDTRQEEERNIMAKLIENVRADKTLTSKAKNMSDEDLKSELMRLEKEQKKWRKQSEKKATSLKEDSMTPKEWEKHLKEVDLDKSKQFKFLTEALADRMEVEKRQKSEGLGLGPDEMTSEIEVSIMADLQEKQQCETNAVQDILENYDDMTLKKMRDIQRLALQEGWFDNVSATVFQMSDSLPVDDPDLHEIEMGNQEQLHEIDKEYDMKKEQVLEQARRDAKPGETIDEEAIVRKLSEECENKKETVKKEMMLQRELTMERLAARKREKQAQEYEQLTAEALMKMASSQSENIKKQVDEAHEKQGNLLQQRLAARRKMREGAKNAEEPNFAKHEATMDTEEDLSRENNTSLFGKLQRERTAVSLTLSEDEKQAQYNKLMRSHMAHQEKLEEQRKRQEEMLRRKLANKKGMKQDDVAELFSLGERQKTVLEKFKEDDKDRQLLKVKEKLANIKHKHDTTDGASSGQMADDEDRQLLKVKEKLANKKRKHGTTGGASSGQMADLKEVPEEQ